MTATTIEIPADIKTELATLNGQAIVVSTAADYERVASDVQRYKGLVKRIKEWFAPAKKQADEAHKSLCRMEAEMLAAPEAGVLNRNTALLDYRRAEQRKADQERLRLQAIADEQARKEREANERKAAAAKKPETREKYLEAAAAVQTAPVVHVAPEIPKVAGMSTRKTWKAEIVDRQALLAFIFQHARNDLITINEKELDRLAKSLKQAASIPGVRFFEQETLASGSY